MQRVLILVTALIAGAVGAWLFQVQESSTSEQEMRVATDLSGAPVDFRAGSGKLKLVNFWASWCKPCVVELPLIEQYASDNSNTLDAVAVAIDTHEHVQDFLKQNPLSLNIVVGTPRASDIMASWGNEMTVLPFSVLLDHDGNLLKAHTGPFNEQSLREFVEH